jgi:hypothetical protein
LKLAAFLRLTNFQASAKICTVPYKEKKMKKVLFFALLLVPFFASAQATTKQVPAVAVVAGQTACFGSYEGSIPGFVPCDNTASSPAAAVGVFTTTGHPATRGVSGSGLAATIVLNGIVTVPIPIFGTLCNAGDLVGDIDSSGNAADLGQPGTISTAYPESYVGICMGVNAFLTQMTILVQPGYVFEPTS